MQCKSMNYYEDPCGCDAVDGGAFCGCCLDRMSREAEDARKILAYPRLVKALRMLRELIRDFDHSEYCLEQVGDCVCDLDTTRKLVSAALVGEPEETK